MQLFEQCQRYYATVWGRRVAYLVNMVLVVLLIAIIYLHLQPIWQNYRQRVAAVPVQIQKVPPMMTMIARRVANQHLFGVAQHGSAPTVVSNIKVLGIFLAKNPKESTAVLSFEGSADDNYWPGDALPGEGKVLSIEANRVIIMQNGQRKAILFDMQEFGDAPATSPSDGASSGATAPINLFNPMGRQQDGGANLDGVGFQVPNEKFQALRERYLKNRENGANGTAAGDNLPRQRPLASPRSRNQ